MNPNDLLNLQNTIKYYMNDSLSTKEGKQLMSHLLQDDPVAQAKYKLNQAVHKQVVDSLKNGQKVALDNEQSLVPPAPPVQNTAPISPAQTMIGPATPPQIPTGPIVRNPNLFS